MKSIYSIVNHEAKAWRYHKKLREQGQTQEARKRERESIRSTIRTIRAARLFSVGRGGFTVRLEPVRGKNSVSYGSVTGHCAGRVYSELLARCRPEVPQYDTTEVDNPLTLLGIPLLARGDNQEDEPNEAGAYGSMSYAPLGVILACYEARGSKVYWGNLNPEEWRERALPHRGANASKGAEMSSTLLMIAHDLGIPYITNDVEVAGALMIDEEIRYHKATGVGPTVNTRTMPAVRERLVVDFGGGIVQGWCHDIVELYDGTDFAFYCHQFSALLEHIDRALEEAQERGYAILHDVVLPVAMSINDLCFVRDYLLEGRVHYERKEAAMHEKGQDSVRQMMRRGGELIYRDLDRIPLARPVMPVSSEVN